jgi:mRNA-degrading endonuclease toxin of MazEF toxin-antitoxin module
MPLPKPEPGLVLSYGYLWKWQDEMGGDTGEKNRPCVIVLAVENNDGDTVIVVVPVTRQQPRSDRGPGRASVEIPVKVQAHLGLDGGRSWIIVDEVNKFVWPGPDLAQIPSQPGKFHYGFIPPKLYKKIIARCTSIAKAHRLGTVTRTV